MLVETGELEARAPSVENNFKVCVNLTNKTKQQHRSQGIPLSRAARVLLSFLFMGQTNNFLDMLDLY